ncbi:MAG: FkbM family methyltransferase [Candidatus Bathyarchaeia archaeon]
MQNDLIFDVGMHNGEDTSYYLKRGCKVVGIDADPCLIEKARKRFRTRIERGQLILVNCAVSHKDNEVVTFYVSQAPLFSSLKQSLAERGRWLSKGTKVHTRTLPSLINEFGCPHYCKIDIEGSEIVCLQTMSCLAQLPSFISVQSECFEVPATEEQALGTLHELHRLGYGKFKLVEQTTLTVLKPGTRFYIDTSRVLWIRIMTWARLRMERWKRLASSRLGYGFALGSSGAFGDGLESEWLEYEAAKETYLFHRRDFLKSRPVNLGFWCDWHASL